MKNKILKIFMGVILLAVIVVVVKNRQATFGSEGLIIGYSIDNLINSSELIVIGEVKAILPSRWNGPNGRNDPENASRDEIARAGGLFTDSQILITQILKGDNKEPIIRVRSFVGETKQVKWVNDSELSLGLRKHYLLFLVKDAGSTALVDRGDYLSVGAFQGVYEIIDGKAISKNDEWLLEDLIAYIQKSLSAESSSLTLSPVPTELLIETLTPSLTTTPTELLIETPTELPTQTSTPTETASPMP